MPFSVKPPGSFSGKELAASGGLRMGSPEGLIVLLVFPGTFSCRPHMMQ